jgi:uncharacterized protein with WD repeat
METRSETPRETWLQPIVALLGEGEFGEAYALAAYFPNTRNRQLVQFAALLGQNKFSEADTLLKKFAAETQSLVAEFATILSQVDLDLLETAYQAIENQYLKYFELSDFCFEFQLFIHPETSSLVVDGLLQLAAQVLIGGNFERGRAYLERAIKLDNSPKRLIQCAKVLLINKPKGNGGKNYIRAVAFSPNGQLIVSASKDHSIQLWDLQGKLVGQEFGGHEGSVNSVAFSPDGQLIVSGSNDKTIQLWNLQGKEICPHFKGHEGLVNTVAFSPDGQLIISGSNDNTIRLWDRKCHAVGEPFYGHEDTVKSIAFSPDGQLIISGSNDRTIRLWNLQGKSIGQPLRGHGSGVSCVAFSPDGQFIVSGSYDTTVRLWNLQGELITPPFQGHDGSVLSVAFSPDGHLIASGSNDTTIRLWDLRGNPIGQPFIGHDDWVRSVAFSPDGQFIVSGSNDETIRLWNLQGNLISINKKSASYRRVTLASDLIHQALNQFGNDKENVQNKLKIAELLAVHLQDMRASRELLIPVIQSSKNAKKICDVLLTLAQKENVQNKLKIAELFAVYLQDLRASRELLIEVIQSKMNTQIQEVLLTLIQKDLYIQPIIYFLLSPTNNLPLIEQLARDFLQSQDFSFQDTALLLLTSVNPSEKENRSLFTKALLKLEPSADEQNVPLPTSRSEGGSIKFNIDKCCSSNIKSDRDKKEHKNVTIERHTRIEFPSECVLEHKVDLKIQLTQEIPKFTRVLEKILLTAGSNIKQFELSVKVTAPAFAIRPYQQRLTVPVKGDSNEVIFTLVPLERGEQVIEIEFFKGATRVGYVIVQTNVTFYSYNKISPKVLSMEDPIDGLKNLESMTVNPDKHTLNVTWIDRESKLLYTIFPANRLGEWKKTIPNIQQQIEDDLRSLNAFLTEVVQQGNPSDERWESICFNLQSVGANLFEMLIPSEVAKKVRDWKIGSPVIISTNEQWIPWELMYDGEDFWGKKFIIARSPRLSDSQDLPKRNRPESKGKRQIKRIVNIVGGDVPSSEAERATHLFSNLLPPEAVHLLAKQPISSLVKAIPGTDVLHFTCHGHLEPHLLQIAGDKNKTRIENLLPETIQRLPLEPGSLVFANACASTVPVLTFGKFSSFGWKFYQRGADAFIGTLGAVPVKYAVNFAEIVYRELFNPDEKITIGQAVAKAKEVAANERNLFWLLYCIYGDPDFSIVQQKNSKEEDHAN